MHIEAVDFFYLAMPEVTDEADGSQDALLVRVAAGGHVGWGECEAAPLPSIAAFVCPKSHGVCRPVADSVLGKRLSEPADIGRLSAEVAYNSMDLLQAPHTFSGIEMALWDVLGKARGQPVWRMLGYSHSHPKTPYASVLFGDTPQETLARAKEMRSRNFIAAKFGWGPIGRGDARTDAEHFAAAREGLGPDGTLLVDTGQIFIDDVERAAERLPALEAARAIWFEEPFAASALEAYGALAQRCNTVKLAGGEGAHNVHMAKHLIDYGRVGFIQIDCGRIGGIGPSKAGRRLRGGEGRHLRQPHLHVAPRAVRLDAAVRGARRSPHLRVSGDAEAARGRDDGQPPHAGCERRDRRARCAGARHHGLRRRRAEISAGRRHPREWAAAVCDGGTVGGARRDWIGIAGSDYRRIWPATLCEARMR